MRAASVVVLRLYAERSVVAQAAALARGVARALPHVVLSPPTPRQVPRDAFDVRRQQVRADVLLGQMPREAPGLWLIAEDAYVPGLDFVFGLARAGQGAMLSTARLPNERMLTKEAVHEVGHFLGLGHCGNACVMRLSGSLREALEKPTTLCRACRLRIA